MILPAAGLLIIDKPSGVTSFWVVKQVKRILRARKVGHCGTLDPLATGVLLVLFGAATRSQAAFMGLPKTYRALVRLGMVTDSGDITGAVTATADASRVTPAAVDGALAAFTGEISQVPPMYSALKKNGRRLYELARRGETVERSPRPVTVYALERLAFAAPRLDLRLTCSRGTYVRTLAEDIGRALGCGATLEQLRRERVGDYDVAQAVDGAELPSLTAEALAARAIALDAFAAGGEGVRGA